ncbi:MAG TPA: DUF4276 family protein [Phycisphaerae bacterium]|nr:DUF4276 family protein [Phycisphaerae bacterium]
MVAVLGEDRSDAESLVELVRNISGRQNQTVFRKGFSGCAELRRKALSHLRLFQQKGCTRFIVCHDADRSSPEHIRRLVRAALGREFMDTCFIAVPVQELEAWLIADRCAIKRAIPSMDIDEVRQPEMIDSPKEWLLEASRGRNSKPLYSPTTFNPKVAAFLDPNMVASKCPSFSVLKDFVQTECWSSLFSSVN